MYYVSAIIGFILMANATAKGQWDQAHATFYGDMGAKETMCEFTLFLLNLF